MTDIPFRVLQRPDPQWTDERLANRGRGGNSVPDTCFIGVAIKDSEKTS